MSTRKRILALSRAELASFVSEAGRSILEDEALAALANPFVSPEICGELAQNPRLTAYYPVRMSLVENRQTPRTHAVKLVPTSTGSISSACR